MPEYMSQVAAGLIEADSNGGGDMPPHSKVPSCAAVSCRPRPPPGWCHYRPLRPQRQCAWPPARRQVGNCHSSPLRLTNTDWTGLYLYLRHRNAPSVSSCSCVWRFGHDASKFGASSSFIRRAPDENGPYRFRSARRPKTPYPATAIDTRPIFFERLGSGFVLRRKRFYCGFGHD